jgi:hypothetical protein
MPIRLQAGAMIFTGRTSANSGMPIEPPKPRLPRSVNVSSRTTTQYAISGQERVSIS